MSSGASSRPAGSPFEPSEVVREIGARPHPTVVVRLAASAASPKPQLAVAECFEGAAKLGNAAGEQFVREARRIATLANPNVARVREVVTRGDDVVVFSELIDGEKLQEMWQAGKLPLEIALRVIVDVLSGAGAIHGLRDPKQQPMKLAHGEISPATIVLGLDGVARLLHAIGRRAPDVEPEPASFGYLAPEVLGKEPYDARADVYSAGILIWEALSGKRLFSEASTASGSSRATRIRAGEAPPASVPEKAAWAKGLVPVVAKALAASPDDRWATAALLAAEIRKAAGLKLAPASTAAAFARSGIGERAQARREALEGATTPAPLEGDEPSVEAPGPDPGTSEPPARAPEPVRAAPQPIVRTPNPAPVAAQPVVRAPDPAPVAAPPVVRTPEPTRAAPPPAAPRAVDPVRPAPPPVASAPEPAPAAPEAIDIVVSTGDSLPPAQDRTVLVAPGVRAEVAEVVELESSLLVAAPDSMPPAPASAIGGFVVDPFAAASAFADARPSGFGRPEPPVVPVAPPARDPVALARPVPPIAEPVPSVTGAPRFAAAWDNRAPTPVAPLGPPRASVESFPIAPLDDLPNFQGPGAKRRKVIILGGVAGLGILIFALAGIRLAMRAGASAPDSSRSSVANAPPSASPPPQSATLAAAVASPSASVTPPPQRVASAAVGVAQAVASAPTPAAAPIPTHPAVTTLPRAAPAYSPPAAKPRPKPTFDPNSL